MVNQRFALTDDLLLLRPSGRRDCRATAHWNSVARWSLIVWQVAAASSGTAMKVESPLGDCLIAGLNAAAALTSRSPQSPAGMVRWQPRIFWSNLSPPILPRRLAFFFCPGPA